MSNSKFRDQLIKIYKKCPITQCNQIECDAAHILPKSICYKLSLQDLVTDPYNGLLLSKNLHTTFDRYLWCFDIYQINWDNSQETEWCQIGLIVLPNKKGLSIQKYKDQMVRVPIHSLFLFWINYRIFMTKNFISNERNIKEMYNGFFSHHTCTKIRENPFILQKWENKRITSDKKPKPFMVIKNRTCGKEVQVLFRKHPWNTKKWINSDSIPSKLIDKFQKKNDEINDPDWK